jgi:hexosaminidase
MMEKAWSPKTLSQDYDAYRQRLSVEGARWAFAGVNFGSISQVSWTPSAMGSVVRLDADHTVMNAPLARLAAGSMAPSDVTATIDWGDGSPLVQASVVGHDYVAAQRQGRDPIAALGSHTYVQARDYHGTVTFSGAGSTWTAGFTVTGD